MLVLSKYQKKKITKFPWEINLTYNLNIITLFCPCALLFMLILHTSTIHLFHRSAFFRQIILVLEVYLIYSSGVNPSARVGCERRTMLLGSRRKSLILAVAVIHSADCGPFNPNPTSSYSPTVLATLRWLITRVALIVAGVSKMFIIAAARLCT